MNTHVKMLLAMMAGSGKFRFSYTDWIAFKVLGVNWLLAIETIWNDGTPPIILARPIESLNDEEWIESEYIFNTKYDFIKDTTDHGYLLHLTGALFLLSKGILAPHLAQILQEAGIQVEWIKEEVTG